MKKIRPTRKRTNKPVGKRGHGQRIRIEDLDKIIENGQLLYEVFWDSGGPGAGADAECVHRLDDKYAVRYSFGDQMGPFDSLSTAITDTELNFISEATVSISSTELTADEIAETLDSTKISPPFSLKINGKTWTLNDRKKFVRMD